MFGHDPNLQRPSRSMLRKVFGILPFCAHVCDLLGPKVFRLEGVPGTLPEGVLEVDFGVLQLCILHVPCRLSTGLRARACSGAISMDQPEVRRVGFPSFALSPPSRARAPLLLWERRSSGSGGGLCAMLGTPKFVPMARPYVFDIPIYLFISLRLGSASFAPPAPDKTNERAGRICTGTRRGRISRNRP